MSATSVTPAVGPERRPLLELRNARVTFGDTRAVQGVSLTLGAGSVHGLFGQNGSGKSSLVKILTGIYRPDQGTQLLVGGQALHLPVSANRLSGARIAVVHQDVGIATSLSIADNVLVRHHPVSRFKRIKARTEREITYRILSRLGLHVDVSKPASVLTEAEKSILAFARALYELERSSGAGPGVLILDEVTARLGPGDSEAVVSTIRRLRDDGWSVLFVGHRLDEVVSICDAVTVLRDGMVAGRLTGSEITTASLLALAMGEMPDLDSEPPPTTDYVDDRTSFSVRVNTGFAVSTEFHGRIGEVVGVTGLAGSGVDALPYALVGYGLRRRGVVRIREDRFELGNMTPRKALHNGVGLIPGDRIRNGVAGTLSTEENLAITRFADTRGHHLLSRVNRQNLANVTKHRIAKYDIRPTDPGRKVAYLSGGNQQKVLVARVLEQDPKMLIAHEPTTGVDAGARAEIFHLIRESARGGCATIVCSQDVDEVWDSSDHVYVLAHGRVVATFDTAVEDRSKCARAILTAGADIVQRPAPGGSSTAPERGQNSAP